jgi:hypothetical protein
LNPRTNAAIYLVFSLLAAALLTILVILTPEQDPTPAAQYIVLAAFTASCLLGITMTMKPRFLRRHQTKRATASYEEPSRAFHGHHPVCPVFQTHTITARNKTWCAGCLGISIGLFIAISLITLFTFSPLVLSPSLPGLLLGFLLILSVYLETLRRHQNPILHLSINSLLAPGYALVTIITIQHTGVLIYGLFALLLCFLWTDTRIQLAYWQHHTQCKNCSEPCKSYPTTD